MLLMVSLHSVSLQQRQQLLSQTPPSHDTKQKLSSWSGRLRQKFQHQGFQSVSMQAEVTRRNTARKRQSRRRRQLSVGRARQWKRRPGPGTPRESRRL